MLMSKLKTYKNNLKIFVKDNWTGENKTQPVKLGLEIIISR